MRVASVMRVRGASIRPARSHPPRRPNTSRNAPRWPRPERNRARDATTAGRYEDVTCRGRGRSRPGYVSQEEHPHGAEQQGASEHEEAGVAEGELEANAQTGRSIHGLLPRRSVSGSGLDAVADAGHGGDDPGFAEAFAQCRDA